MCSRVIFVLTFTAHKKVALHKFRNSSWLYEQSTGFGFKVGASCVRSNPKTFAGSWTPAAAFVRSNRATELLFFISHFEKHEPPASCWKHLFASCAICCGFIAQLLFFQRVVSKECSVIVERGRKRMRRMNPEVQWVMRNVERRCGGSVEGSRWCEPWRFEMERKEKQLFKQCSNTRILKPWWIPIGVMKPAQSWGFMGCKVCIPPSIQLHHHAGGAGRWSNFWLRDNATLFLNFFFN